MMHREWQCPICCRTVDAQDLPNAPFFKDGRYRQCGACGTILLWPLPTREENLAFEGDATAEEICLNDDQRLPLLRRRVNLAAAPPPDGGRLLDIGCSAGHVMALAHDAGWQVTGIEMSAALAQKAQQRISGEKILVGDIMQMDLAPLGTFDVVIALDVIEHVLNPEIFLRRIAELLKHEGKLILHTPNAKSLRARLHGGRWNMLIPEYHFFLFTPQSLETLVSRCGFESVKISTTSGTGFERGLSAFTGSAKEKILQSGMLGNGLLLTAHKASAQ